MSGSRLGALTWPRRLLSRAMAHDLTAFVVPDQGLAETAGLDLWAAGLRPVATPRHATVLVIIGPIPGGLASGVAVVYAQMPRPRVILAAGVSAVAELPAPDVVSPLDQDALQRGVAALRRQLAEAAFAPEVENFEIAAAQTHAEYVCPMHPEVVRSAPGSCPICGMDLVAREAPGAIAGDAHHDHDSMVPRTKMSMPAPPVDAGTVYTCPMHPEVVERDPGRCPICGMTLMPREDEGAPSPPKHVSAVTSTYTCPMHPRIAQSEPGRCPICGMDLVPAVADPERPTSHAGHRTATAQRNHEAEHADHKPDRIAGAPQPATARMDAEDPPGNDHRMEHSAVTPNATRQSATAMDVSNHDPPIRAMNHSAADQGSVTAAATDHEDLDHGAGVDAGMDHSMHDGGFMSMVAMTKDLPRSDDGLPMEWLEVPFGPLFPRLPGGLNLTFTLDGDGVARTAVATGATARRLAATWPGPLATFPERLERVDPMTPVAYRLLARRALEAIAGVATDERTARGRVRDAEWERIGNHLGWLSAFTSLIGDRRIGQRAAALHLAVTRAKGEVSELSAGLNQEIRAFVAVADRAPLISRRLAGIGMIEADEPERLCGPIARASGVAADARTGDAAYQLLGFTPVIRTGGDALARYQVRLAEIVASLDLITAVASGDVETNQPMPVLTELAGTADAVVETPRGAARLQLIVAGGSVVAVHLEAPSSFHIRLISDVATGAEVADALVVVASLDLSPWEVDQ